MAQSTRALCPQGVTTGWSRPPPPVKVGRYQSSARDGVAATTPSKKFSAHFVQRPPPPVGGQRLSFVGHRGGGGGISRNRKRKHRIDGRKILVNGCAAAVVFRVHRGNFGSYATAGISNFILRERLDALGFSLCVSVCQEFCAAAHSVQGRSVPPSLAR